jgi:hypothetical protein
MAKERLRRRDLSHWCRDGGTARDRGIASIEGIFLATTRRGTALSFIDKRPRKPSGHDREALHEARIAESRGVGARLCTVRACSINSDVPSFPPPRARLASQQRNVRIVKE